MADHRTDVLPVLLEIWEGALGRPVAPDDDFYGLDGDSLKATLIVARIRHRFEVKLTLAKFLTEVTTPAQLAKFVTEKARESA